MSETPLVITNGMPGVTFTNDTLKMTLTENISTQGKQIALRSANFYKSWRNVTQALGNNTLSYIFNGSTYPIVFDDGYYSFKDISAYVQLVQTQNGHYLFDELGNAVYFLSITLNPVYYSMDIVATPIPTSLTGDYADYTNPKSITLSGNSPQLIIPAGTASFLGHAAGTYPSSASVTVSTHRSTSTPQFDQVTQVLVHCSWCDNSTSVFPQLVAQIDPSIRANGSILPYEPPNSLIWVKALEGNQREISIRFSNQTNEPLRLRDLQGASATIELRHI